MATKSSCARPKPGSGTTVFKVRPNGLPPRSDDTVLRLARFLGTS
jgi:hypothetical protein